MKELEAEGEGVKRAESFSFRDFLRPIGVSILSLVEDEALCCQIAKPNCYLLN